MANNDGLSQNLEIFVDVNEPSLDKTQKKIARLSMAREIEINVKGIKTAGGRVDAGKAIADAIGVDVSALVIGKFKKLSAEVEAKLNKAQQTDLGLSDADLSSMGKAVSLFAKKYNDLVDSINESTKGLGSVSGLKVSEEEMFGIDKSILENANSRNKKVAASAVRELNTYLDILEKIAKGQALNNNELLKVADFDYGRDSKIVKRGYTKKDGERVPEVRADQITVSPGLASAVANKLIAEIGDQLAFSKPFKASGGLYESVSNRDTGTDRPIVQTLPNKGLYQGKEAYQASPEETAAFQKEVVKRSKKGQFKDLQEALLDRVIQDFDGITEALLDAAKKRLLGFKNIQDLIKNDPTWSADGLSSEDAMQGTMRYVVEEMQSLLPQLESEKGYKPGTYLAHGANFKSEIYGTTFDQLPDTGSDIVPPGFINKVLSDTLGEITGEITNSLPDAIRENIAEPIEQIFQNPGILGKGFATTPAQQIGKFIGKDKTSRTLEDMIVDPSAVMSTSFIAGGSTFKEGAAYELNFVLDLIEANKRNLEITTSSADKEARSKRIADLAEELKMLEAKHGMTAEEARLRSVGVSAVRSEDSRLNAEERSKAIQAEEALSAAAYNSELARIKSVGVESLKSADAKLKAEQKAEEQKIANQKAAEKRAADQAAADQKAAEAKIAAEKKAAESKPEKRVGIIPMPIPESDKRPPAQLDVAAKAAAAVMPQLDKYRPVIGDAIVDSIVKVIGEAGGDVSKITAAFDTEFIENNKKPIYEAGVTLKNAVGDFVDIFKMVQIPVGKQSEIDYRLTTQGAGAKSVQDVKDRATTLGIPLSEVGNGSGSQADMMQYRDKLIQLGTVIQALDEVGISLAGNKIVDADFRLLAQSFQSVNDALAGVEGIDQIKVPSPTNVADLLKIVEILKKTPGLEDGLATLVQGKIVDGKDKGDTALGALLKKVLDMRPGAAEAYGVKRTDSGFAFGDTPAHFAVADNRAALIVLDFLKEFAQSANLIASGTGILSEKYGAGTAGPYGNEARAKYPSAFGGGFAVDPAERAAAADNLVLETNAQEANNRAVKTGAELAQKRLNDDKEYKKLLEELTDARKAYQIVNGAVQNNGIILPADKAVLESYLVKLDELAKTSQDAAIAAASIRTALGEPSKQAAFVARRDVKAVGEELSLKKSEMAYKSEAAVKEISDKRKAQSGKNYENTAVQVEKNITRAASERGRVLKDLEQHEPGGYDTAKIDREAEKSRRGAIDVPGTNDRRMLGIEQETKARKDASETIKRLYKDQVQAEKEVQAATKASINQWVTGRYALYDVGNAYQNVSTQLFRVARRIFDLTKSYRDYETAFTSVERAMQLDFGDEAGGAKQLKDEFIRLSEVTPIAFEELSRIATLGAQMGIGAQGIVQFTETVSQFAAVTGISADTVAQKFGKIAELTNLPTDQFDKLGSAVTFAGVNAVATESDILTLSESIAAVSSQVGMTTPDVVGLGTALSSVGIPAEQARGVFTRVFADIDRAVATGGKSLDAFASTAGMSGKDFSAAWGQQGKSYDVFRAMLGGINSAADLTKAFDKLGITETREINTLTRLANNLNVVDSAMTDAAASFGDGRFLLQSFSKTTDNLDSKLTIFRNNLKSLGEQFGQNFGATLKNLLDVSSDFVKLLKDMSTSPVLQFLSSLSFVSIGVVGAYTGMVAILAKVTAQIYAFRVAMINSANDSSAITGITKQIKQLTSVGGVLVEVRDKLQSPNDQVRGEVRPVDIKLRDFLRGEEARRAALLSTENIFLASNRKQADAIQGIIRLRQHEIEAMLNDSQQPKLHMDTDRARLLQKTLYVEVIGNEARALTQNEYAELQNAAAAERAANVKNGEATARLKNTTALNGESAAAVGMAAGVGGLGTRVMGFLGAAGIAATVLTTIVGIVDGITRAVNDANSIDLAGSGLTVEALKDTIKQDTQAWMDNKEAIATQSSAYQESSAETNKYAQAISGLDDNLRAAYGSQMSLVTATKNQTVALGDATKTLIINSILANDKITALLDKNQNMFYDLADSGFNLSNVIDTVLGDPKQVEKVFKDIEDEISNIQLKIRALNEQSAMDTAMVVPNSFKIEELQGRQEELRALGDAAKAAYTEIQKAIARNTIIEMGKGYSAGFVGLEAKMKSATKTGKGMAAVLKLVKAAASDLIKNTNIKVNFDSANSIEEMLKVVKAAKETARGLALANKGLSMQGAAGALAAIDAEFAPLLKNLNLLNTSANDVDSTVGGAAESAADKLKRLIGAANSTVSAAMNLNGALRSLGESLKASKDWSLATEGGEAKFSAILSVINQIGDNAGSNFPKAIRELQAFQIVLKGMGATDAALNLVSKAIKAIGGDATLTAKQVAALKKAFPALFANMEKQLTSTTEKSLKTLSEYASDLKSVLSSAFEYRYAKQSNLDDIASAWQAIKDSAKSAQEAIDDANKTMMGLNADKNLIEYQLKIAIKYNDLERQKFLRNKLGETNASLAEESAKIVEANALKDKSLKGDSKTVIDNRNQVRGLVQTYTNYLATLAASGMSSTDLKAKAGTLAEEFLTQGQNLGFAKSELKEYTDAFQGDFKKAIDGVPNEVTLKVNTDPALRAIEEFVKKANTSLAKVDIVGNNGTGSDKPSADEISAYKSDKVSSTLFALTSWQRAAAAEKVKAFEDKYGKVYAANGGYIAGPGTGTSDSVPAMLSNGEYVIKASSVKSLGTDFLDEVNARGSRFANGGFMNTAGYNAGHAKPKAKSKGILDKVQDFFKTKIDLGPIINPVTSPIFKKLFDLKENKQNKAVNSKISSTLKSVTGLLSGNPLMHGLAYDATTSLFDSMINLGANKGSIGDLANSLIAAIPGGKQASGITGAGLKAVVKTLSATRRSFPAEGLASNPNGKIKLIDPALRAQNEGSQVFGPGTYFAKNLDASFKNWGSSYGTQLERMTMTPAAMLKMARSKGYMGLGEFKELLGADKGTLGTIKMNNPLVQDLLKQGYLGLTHGRGDMLTSWILGSQKGLGLKKFADLHPETNSWLNPTSIQKLQNKMRLDLMKKGEIAQFMSPNKVTEKIISDMLKKMGNLLKGNKGKTVPSRPTVEGSTGGLVTPKAIVPKYFADGGYAKGTDTIPAMLTPGEFVMSSGAVSKYGVDFLNALNQQRASFSPVQPQAQAQQSQGSQMVYLSPEDRQLLRAAIDRPVALYTENTKIAQSANAGNLLLAQRGSN